jgi:hypothetical protein
VKDRFCRLLGQAEALFSPDEDAAVEQGFRPLTENRVLDGPYGLWLRDLRDGCCRLPKLPAAVMKALLLAWLTPVVTGGVTCKGCGLEYPHQNDRPLLAACPCCASREWDWTHLVRDYDRAWKALDGYAGGKDARRCRPPRGPQEAAERMLTRRQARLEAKLPPPSPELEVRLRQCDPVFERWDALGAEEQCRVNEALAA